MILDQKFAFARSEYQQFINNISSSVQTTCPSKCLCPLSRLRTFSICNLSNLYTPSLDSNLRDADQLQARGF